MKRVLMAAALAATATGVASADVSKAELKKLITAGFGDDLIVAYVKANDGVERLSADDLIDLKRADATDALLVAVLGAKAEARAAAIALADRGGPDVIRPEVRTAGRHPGVIDLGGLPYWSPKYDSGYGGACAGYGGTGGGYGSGYGSGYGGSSCGSSGGFGGGRSCR